MERDADAGFALHRRRRPDQQARKGRRKEPLLNVKGQEGSDRRDGCHEEDLPFQSLPAPGSPKEPPRRGEKQQGGEDLRGEAALQHVSKVAQETAGSLRGLYSARAGIARIRMVVACNAVLASNPRRLRRCCPASLAD